MLARPALGVWPISDNGADSPSTVILRGPTLPPQTAPRVPRRYRRGGLHLRGQGLVYCNAAEGFRQERFREVLSLLERRDRRADVSCAYLLRCCGRGNSLLEVKRVHAAIIRCGYDKNVLLGNVLIEAYGKCGAVENGRAVFDEMVRRNEISWSVMLVAYTRNGYDRQALELFRQMEEDGVKPDSIVFISVLGACGRLAALAEGKVIHASIAASGLESVVVVGNSLIDMYGKCGSPENARAVFDKMHLRNVVSWTAIISAYSQNGHGKEALEHFRQMHKAGSTPNVITFVTILGACASVRALSEGKVIHASIVASGLKSDVLASALVNMYGKCGSSVDARRVFDAMRSPTVVCWNSVIAAYGQNGNVNEALLLLLQMQQKGMEPDSITFVSILTACTSLGALTEGKVIHANIIAAGLVRDVTVGNSLVNMYGKCKSVNDARRVFDEMRIRNVVSWTVMIAAYCQNGHGKKALELFLQMQEGGVKPDNITYLTILDACAGLVALAEGKVIHASIVSSGLESDVVVGNSLINMYGKCGSPLNARRVFEKMCLRNVVSWTSVITAYGQNGNYKEALELFWQMQQEGLTLDIVTFVTILDTCGNLAALTEGKVIHALIVASGLESNDTVCNALINMYGKCGSLENARCVFCKMCHPNVISWTTMIAAYGQNGHGEDASKLFLQMQQEGVKPDSISFVNILSACAHAGLVDEGCYYFASMSRDHGILPTAEHYGCMIDLLGRAGLLEEAEDLIKNMPWQPDVVIWVTLLGACRIHGDVERGARAAEHIFELDPMNAAQYVLLSNIYAAAGRWNDVARVRKSMEDSGVKKQPGCSWIEVNGRVHKFFVGDKLHPKEEDIYTELRSLSRQMKEVGYVPDTMAVLHDVGEEEKEEMLCSHSEKLAIAFGLISVPCGAPIHITKNLRVCSDCHSAAKLISKIVRRKIIIRDANCFHHFEHGECSCGDYW